MKLTFKLLRDTVRCCTLKYVSGDWSEAVVKLYASTRGINTQGIDNIMEHGNSIIFDNENKRNSVTLHSLSKATINQDLFEPWMGGPFWKSPLSINSFIDVIMHLFFLGIVKATKELMSDWMLECRRQNCFKQSSKKSYCLFMIWDWTALKF